MNQNTCITIDVSQNKSHIQGFIGSNKPLSKARTMRHTKQGYQVTALNTLCTGLRLPLQDIQPTIQIYGRSLLQEARQPYPIQCRQRTHRVLWRELRQRIRHRTRP